MVGRFPIELGAPWRFIWTKFQPEIFDFDPVRINFRDFRGFGIDLALQMYPPEHGWPSQEVPEPDHFGKHAFRVGKTTCFHKK